MNNKQKPILYDKQIIGRVQKCLEESSKKNLADFGTVTRLLQTKYPEYRRRRQGPFRQLVKQAYRIICEDLYENLNSAEAEPEQTESESETDEETPQVPQRNILNNIFQNLYKKTSMDPTSADEDTRDTRKTDDVISLSSEEERSSPMDTNGCPTPGNLHNEDSPNAELADTTNGSFPIPTVQEEVSCPSNIVQEDTEVSNPIAETVSVQSSSKRKGTQSSSQLTPRKRVYRMPVNVEKTTVNFENIAGIDHILKQLCENLMNVVVPGFYLELGAKPPNGILLCGPTGCGKTTLAEAIAGQLEFHFISITATELICGISGESEERIREIFEQAIINAPCVLFIDEIDAIGTNRSTAQKEMQKRITSQLITCLDTLKEKSSNARILVIGATCRPDLLDAALRRPGRFDHEILIPVPDRKGRYEILERLCRDLTIEQNFDYEKIAELTPGYVAADIVALISRACGNAVKRLWTAKLFEMQNTPTQPAINPNDSNDSEKSEKTVIGNTDENESNDTDNTKESNGGEITNEKSNSSPDNRITISDLNNDNWEPKLQNLIDFLNNPPQNLNLHNFAVTMQDFTDALKIMQPSAKREGFITVPDVTWDDIGSLHEVRDQLRLAILAPVKYPKTVERLGITTPTGVLLCGPPGCGKTLIAKAIANEAGINFISVKGPEMMNMYVGESERAVRECFQRARNSAPCVIFFDEFDSLCPKRSSSSDSSSGVRIVNQLLTEMDGVVERKGVYVLAATNRPDIIDPAILRPGRLDNILYVGMPDVNDRYEILKAATKNGQSPVLHADVDFKEIAELTNGYTGADLSGLIRQASLLALKNAIANNVSEENIFVTSENIKRAMELTRPSVTERDREVYEDLRIKYAPKTN